MGSDAEINGIYNFLPITISNNNCISFPTDILNVILLNIILIVYDSNLIKYYYFLIE